MLTSTELELRSEMTPGTLETNALVLKDLVLSKLEEYRPENYEGRADEAKSDRAILNNAEKQLNSRRLELERAYMEPFNTFKAIITDTCKAIKQASGTLDEIVKAEENREKEAKRNYIEGIWLTKNFTLFDLDKIFSQKWLNKTAKLKDIEKEMDEAINKTFSDLTVLENFPEEDVPLLKSYYLETLDISAAMRKANDLKANRDRLAKEKAEREATKEREALTAQEREESRDAESVKKQASMTTLVAAAMEEEPSLPCKEEYALVFEGTREQMLRLRQYMTEHGITYKKLEKTGAGKYQAA